MTNSLLSTITSTLDSQTVERVAACLGAPAQSVLQGFQSSIASVLGTLASKSEDSHELRRILDLNPPTLADTTISDVARAASEPGSALISGGQRLLAGLFGKSQDAVTDSVTATTGLRRGVASAILAMTAPWVLSFINRRVHAEGLSMTGLGNILQHETAGIRDALPAGVGHLLWPPTVRTASPVLAESAHQGSSPLRWLLPLLALAVLIPAIAWVVNHAPSVRPSETTHLTPRPGNFGTANRVASGANRTIDNSIDFIRGALADNVLRFGPGSSKLLPESEAKLDQIASTLKAYPDVHATVSGYADNSGSAEKNLALSRNRADSVMSELVRKGIAGERLSAGGYGQEDPIADNSTAKGRLENRRVTVSISEP